MRGLSTVAAFVVFLLAFAVVMFSVFYFYNALREATQRGVEAIYSAVTRDVSTGIYFDGKICNLTGGRYIFYIVTDEAGRVVYNGSGPSPCPPARLGLYTYRAVRRDGGLDVALAAVGNLSLSFSADRSNAVVNDYNRSAAFKIRALLVNPNGAYALLTNITATPAAAGFTCAPSTLRVDKPLLIPPGGSLAVDMGAVTCNATDTYLYVQGAPPVPLNVTGAAYYNGVTVASAAQSVASVAAAPPKPGNFTAYGGECRVGYFSGDAPRYYVLLSGASPVARGLVNAIEGSYAVVPCPASSGFFRYRVVTASGAVVEVPVSVGRVLAWAESNMTVAYVNGTGQSVFFDLYLRFTNPNAGYTALNFTYTLMYNTQLLSCSLYAGQVSGTLTLQPGETRAIYVATYRCVVLNEFNETNIAVNITATYTGGGYTATLYRGVVGKPSFAGAPSWVVLKILWGNGTAVANPGYSALQLAYRKSLATLRWAPVARPPPTCPPTLVYVNKSLFPLLSASWALAGSYNVTTLTMKVFPGWPEDYVPATLAPTASPQSLSLLRTGFSGSGLYSIYLGGLLQFSDSAPGPGPPVALPAPLRWLTTTDVGYVASANASVPAICTYPLLNFKAQPMSKLYQQTFSCGASQLYDGFSGYCSTYTTGFGDVPLKSITTSARSTAYLDSNFGNPPPSVYTEGKNGYGGAFLNLSSWIGGLSATGSFSIQYYLKAGVTGADYVQLNFFIDTNGDGRPDVEVVYYMSVGGSTPLCLSSRIYNYSISCTPVLYSSRQPPAGQWLTWTISKIYNYGVVVGVAFGAYSPNGDTKTWWDNLAVTKCVLPPNVVTYTRGQQYTRVYIDPGTSPTYPPSLATEVDAYGASNNPPSDWGAAIAVYRLSSPVPAYGTAVSAWGRYVRNATDAQNNVAYLSIGVDTNGDGQVDKEYIIYRYDVSSSYSGAIVSAFFRDSSGNPVYVCTVGSAGTCTTTDPRFVVVNAGSMASGNKYQWSYTLYDQGAVVAVAFTAVDASYYASGTAGDFWVFWDDLTIQYSACPPPAGWSTAGSYVWQSYNYLLVSGSATAYMPLITAPTRALTYVANFTGVGTYAVFDSSLNVIFGVSASGGSFTALCGGASTPLGSLPAARYVELRPLSGLGDIIVRDQYGAILARYGCIYTTTPQYVGFRGGLLRVYQVEAWG
jgi:hypothetical protein